jgi:alkylation response protein AidB-like acyl-CoA dehydrogenase
MAAEDAAMSKDLVTRARALQPVIREAADAAEQARRLPDAVAKAMAAEGLYRVAAARSIGGAEAPPEIQIRVIESIAEADGSVGWNLMIGIETFGLLGLAFERGAEIFADPLLIASSATSATGRAEPAAGGYRVSGQWPFVSGCHNSAFFAGLVGFFEAGEPVPGRLPGFAVMPRSDFEILDTWNVSGLRGSGSHDVQAHDVFVPEEFVTPGPWFVDRSDLPAVFRIPLGIRLAYNKAAVGFGIARGALDAFVELAHGKVPRFSSSTLRERPLAQRAIAAAEARLRGARALVFDLVGETWQKVLAGDDVTLRERALFHIACADAASACAEAVDGVSAAAGTSANRLDSPLERRARDARVIRQHVTVAPGLLEDGGRVLLGLEPESFILKLPG